MLDAKYPIIKISGDTSVMVVFGNEITGDINTRIRAFDEALTELEIDGIYETVPTYCALTIHYAPEVIRYEELHAQLAQLLSSDHRVSALSTLIMEIPVCYGGEFGPDLEYVAEHNHLSVDDVIRIHSEGDYLIYMLGFTPGFSYLGGMDKRIATPRLKDPRLFIPAGSVGVAGDQTGIYPIDSPGGWQIIGRSPVRLYDADRDVPILLDAGMHVKFIPIDLTEYNRILAQVENGRYRIHSYIREDR